MTRIAARGTLLAIALVTLTGLYVLRIAVNYPPWPIETGHPRVLVFLAVIIAYVFLALAALFAAVEGIRYLLKKAELL